MSQIIQLKDFEEQVPNIVSRFASRRGLFMLLLSNSLQGEGSAEFENEVSASSFNLDGYVIGSAKQEREPDSVLNLYCVNLLEWKIVLRGGRVAMRGWSLQRESGIASTSIDVTLKYQEAVEISNFQVVGMANFRLQYMVEVEVDGSIYCLGTSLAKSNDPRVLDEVGIFQLIPLSNQLSGPEEAGVRRLMEGKAPSLSEALATELLHGSWDSETIRWAEPPINPPYATGLLGDF